MVFRIIAVLAFILTYIWFFKLIKKNHISLKAILNSFSISLKESWSNLLIIKSHGFDNKLKTIKSFLLLITIVELKVMAITGFLPIIFTGEHLTGIILLIHVAVAPLIAVTFAVLVILFAHTNRFNKNDLQTEDENRDPKSKLKVSGKLKIIFWTITVFSIPAMLSIILGMFPLFGTDGQLTLLEIHRYSVLIITILVILYIGLYSTISKEKLISNT